MTDVYYTYTNAFHNNPFPEAICPDPTLLLKDVAKNYQSFPNYRRLMQCPSVRDSIDHTYVVKSPIDLQLTWNQHSELECLLNPDNGGRVCSDVLYPHIELFLDNQPVFIAEKPVTMHVLPAFMHEDAPQYPFLGGRFDISQWYRPVHPTYLMHRGQSLSIKANQALMYVQFDRRVKLRRFAYTEKFGKDLEHLVEARRHIPIKKMQDLYNFFALAKRKRFFLDEIKRNLL